MENTPKSPFRFEGYKILKSTFELSDVDGEVTFNIGFAPSGTIYSEAKRFELVLNVMITDSNNNFKIELSTVGIFSFESEVTIDTLNKLFYMNAPAILFPYIRAYITTLSSLSGITPIIIPTLNLSNLGKELEKNTINANLS